MDQFKVNIEKTIYVTQEDIDDIMCSALEGGITYWCSHVDVVGDYLVNYASEQISRGGILQLHDAEEDAVYTLTKDKLLNGIKLAIEYDYCSSYNWLVGSRLDTGQIDGIVADIIVQLSLFSDVIYG